MPRDQFSYRCTSGYLAICKFVIVGIDFSDKSKLYIFPSIQSVEANYIRESLLKWIQEIYF